MNTFFWQKVKTPMFVPKVKKALEFEREHHQFLSEDTTKGMTSLLNSREICVHDLLYKALRDF